MKINVKYISKRFAALALAGTLALASGGCGKSKKQSEDVTTTENITTEATATVDANQEYYEEVINLEKDIVSFGEQSLPNGFITLDESNKLEMAELFTNAYIQMNNSTISKKAIAVLDQDLDLVPTEITRDFMEFCTDIARYYQIATPETNLAFENLIKDTNDLEFITNLANTIAEMNVAETSDARQQKINEIIEIKKSLLTNPNIAVDYNSETLYLATKLVVYSDAMAKAYGSEIITSSEEEIQLYSSFYNQYCDVAVTSGYIEGADIDKGQIASQSSFESKYLSTSDKIMTSIIDKVSEFRDQDYDDQYSYEEVTKYIAEKLVGLYVAPEQTNIERENAARRATSDAIDKKNIGKSTTKVVDEKDVPKDKRIPTTEESKDENNNTTTETYNKARAAGITDGSDDAWRTHTASGKIPSKKSLGAEPSKTSNDYNAIYNYFYAVGWNNYVNSAVNSKQDPTTEYVPVENGEEVEEKTTENKHNNNNSNDSTEKTTQQATTQQTTTQETTTEVEYIPVEDGEETEEVIDEGMLTSSLKNYRDKLLAAYINSYMNSFYEEENENVKTV